MMFTKITLNLLIIKTIYCENFNFHIDMFMRLDTNSNATECIKSVVQKYFPCGTVMTLIGSNEDDELIQTLNSDSDCYSFIVRYYDDKDWLPTQVYIIRAKNVADLLKGTSMIINDLLWNPRGRFIIELETSKEDDVESVFYILMQHKVFDAVLIRKHHNGIVVIDTYYPFKDNNCGKKVETATIGNCKDIERLDCFRNEKICLRNCTVKVAASQDIPNIIFESRDYTDNGKPLQGLEQFLLETIAERESIKLKYIPVKRKHSFGIVMENHTATGLLGILQNSDVDIAAGGFVLIKNRVVLFDYLWGYGNAAFKVFTPAIGEEIWRTVYQEFGKETWMLIVISYCLVAIIGTIRRKFLLRMSRNDISVALQLWGYFYLNTSSRLSKEKGFRVIIFFWIWFTFFVSTFYNTALYSLLTGRDQITRHISIDRLRELPYKPCISLSTRTFFLYAFNQTLPEGEDIPECKFTDTALDYVAKQRNVYAIEMEYVYALNKYKYTDEDSNSLFDTWSFSINNVIAMYFTKGFPMMDKFQLYALQIYESGMLEKQLDKINRIKNHNPQPKHKVHFEKMWLSDLRIHFYTLMLGYMISMYCFILEIIWHRYSVTL